MGAVEELAGVVELVQIRVPVCIGDGGVDATVLVLPVARQAVVVLVVRRGHAEGEPRHPLEVTGQGGAAVGGDVHHVAADLQRVVETVAVEAIRGGAVPVLAVIEQGHGPAPAGRIPDHRIHVGASDGGGLRQGGEDGHGFACQALSGCEAEEGVEFQVATQRCLQQVLGGLGQELDGQSPVTALGLNHPPEHVVAVADRRCNRLAQGVLQDQVVVQCGEVFEVVEDEDCLAGPDVHTDEVVLAGDGAPPETAVTRRWPPTSSDMAR